MPESCVRINEDRSKQHCQSNNISTMSHVQTPGSIHEPSVPSVLCFRMNSAVDDSNEEAQMCGIMFLPKVAYLC